MAMFVGMLPESANSEIGKVVVATFGSLGISRIWPSTQLPTRAALFTLTAMFSAWLAPAASVKVVGEMTALAPLGSVVSTRQLPAALAVAVRLKLHCSKQLPSCTKGRFRDFGLPLSAGSAATNSARDTAKCRPARAASASETRPAPPST